MIAVLGEIFAIDLAIIQHDVRTGPQRLLCVLERNMIEAYMPGSSESLWRCHGGISHMQRIDIPESGASRIRERGMVNIDIGGVPQRVFPFEMALLELKILAMFQWTFTLCENTSFQRCILQCKQGALLGEMHIEVIIIALRRCHPEPFQYCEQ